MAKVLPFSVSKKASLYRRRAQDYRALAKTATDKDQREHNEVIAAAYLSLAETEEWLAGARAHPVPSLSATLPPVDYA